ncbi:hypothetical protein EON80_17335 [bacterium]|nr:MAG: hypothetical protein EON80_17335 [bacterium]
MQVDGDCIIAAIERPRSRRCSAAPADSRSPRRGWPQRCGQLVGELLLDFSYHGRGGYRVPLDCLRHCFEHRIGVQRFGQCVDSCAGEHALQSAYCFLQERF